jgi:hypothetical protein
MNGGLAILDAVHMPYGCGTWPAWWTTDVPNWPHNGEIDILEGVNGYVRNQASLHTAVGCTISNDYGSTGTLAASTNCAAEETGNMGCGQVSTQSNSYGKPFNDNGGGVYASEFASFQLVFGKLRYCSVMAIDWCIDILFPSQRHSFGHHFRGPSAFDLGYTFWQLAQHYLRSCNLLERPSDHIYVYDLVSKSPYIAGVDGV